jgi:hypothetical protein
VTPIAINVSAQPPTASHANRTSTSQVPLAPVVAQVSQVMATHSILATHHLAQLDALLVVHHLHAPVALLGSD